MKYESEFRIKEKEFYPREKYSHKKVIDELANIVKRADLEIDEAEETTYKALVMLGDAEKKAKRLLKENKNLFKMVIILGLLNLFTLAAF